MTPSLVGFLQTHVFRHLLRRTSLRTLTYLFTQHTLYPKKKQALFTNSLPEGPPSAPARILRLLPFPPLNSSVWRMNLSIQYCKIQNAPFFVAGRSASRVHRNTSDGLTGKKTLLQSNKQQNFPDLNKQQYATNKEVSDEG